MQSARRQFLQKIKFPATRRCVESIIDHGASCVSRFSTCAVRMSNYSCRPSLRRNANFTKDFRFVCIVLGLAVAGGIRLSGQTAGAEANRFQAGVGVHQTRTESLNSLQFPKQTELAQETEPASSL